MKYENACFCCCLFNRMNKSKYGYCSECGYISPTNRKQEKFICEVCGHQADADVDAAKVILKRGLAELGITLNAVSGVPRKQDKSTPKEPVVRQGQSPALAGEPGNPLQF